MSEVEKKLEEVLTEYAKMDDGLKAMYVSLRELDTVSENYSKTKTSLDASAGNLKATSEALIQEIEVLKDLAKKLGASQITVFNEKLDNLEITLQKHQEILLKNKKASSVILWLMAITLGLLTFTIFVN